MQYIVAPIKAVALKNSLVLWKKVIWYGYVWKYGYICLGGIGTTV